MVAKSCNNMRLFIIIDAIQDQVNLKYIREQQNTLFFRQIGNQNILFGVKWLFPK